ncbi:MAG: shikimate kinase [Geminicoccaceae bacterium]
MDRCDSAGRPEGGDATGLIKPIVLVGLMGAGKSAVGRRLAQALAIDFVDSDAEIEHAAGMSIADIFQIYGEGEFRDVERRVIGRLIDEHHGVIALGGGAFVDPLTRARTRERTVTIWLQADLKTLVERTSRRPGKRPLLSKGDPSRILADLMAKREPVYAQAHGTVRTGDEPIERVVERVLATARNLGAVH